MKQDNIHRILTQFDPGSIEARRGTKPVRKTSKRAWAHEGSD